MTTRKQLSALARRQGATIDWAPGDSVLYADAPRGKRWDASDCHVICAAYDNGQPESDARDFLYTEMEYGLTDCNCEECRIND